MSTQKQSILEKNEDTATEEQRRKVLEQFAEPRRNTAQAMDDARRHSDARSMREYFGIPGYNREAFDYPSVIPNCLEKTWDAPVDEDEGGTDFLARGKPGTGKSTLANYIAVRDLEINDSKVVWRGSSSRSEWLALAPWTRLCLPAGVDVNVRLESKDPRKPQVDLDVDDLGEIVRTVVRYEDPIDLNHNHLKEGALHVVYPDPRMRGCQEVYEASEERTYGGLEFSPDDPASHWWFAWFLARIESGPHHWTTWICDEIGDLAPQSAQKDDFATYQKVEMLKDAWVDARKFGLSCYLFGHSETDIHDMIRKKLRWRVQMRGTANPTSKNDIVGFESIPMKWDITSQMSVGEALMYTETNFSKFGWKDMPSRTDYKLKISMGDSR